MFSYARGSAPCIPGAEPGRRWLAGGAGAPGAPAAKPGRHWLFLPRQYFLPPSPDPLPPWGRGGDFWFILPGAGAPGTPAAKSGRHWLFSAMSVLFAPIPPAPLPGGKGEIFCFLMQGAPPLASPGLSPGGTGSIGGGLAPPGTPAAKPTRRWLAGRLRPAHPCYRSRAALVMPSERKRIKYYQSTILSEMPLSMHIYESSGGYGGLFQESPDVSFPQKVGIRGRESFEMLLQRKGKCGIL